MTSQLTGERDRPLLADGTLLAITALWGATFVVVKDSLAAADPFTFLTLRFTLGALVAAVIARGALKDRAAWRGGVVLGLFLFIGYAFQTFGLDATTPSRSAFVTGLSLVFVPFVSLALSRRRPGVPALIGTAFAVAGLYSLTGFELASPSMKGDLLTLACAVAYAFHIALTERYAPGANPVALVTVQLAVTAVLSAVAIPFGTPRLESGLTLWIGVGVTGVLASAVAISLQVWAQARTTAVRAALIFSLEPVFAAAYSAALGRDSLSRREVMGGALIVAGVLISEAGAALLRRGSHAG